MTDNVNFEDFDAVLAAGFDDLADLPPMGVPPSGCYTLSVTASSETAKDGGKYIKFAYTVLNVDSVNNEEEAAGAANGMQFAERFSPIKKDGTVNTTGIGFLKAALRPFQVHFSTNTVGETLEQINGVTVVASLLRTPDRREEGRWNFKLSDVTVV